MILLPSPIVPLYIPPDGSGLLGSALTPGAQESTLLPGTVTVTLTPTVISSTTPPTTSPGSPLNMATIIGATIAASVLVTFTIVVIVSVVRLIKCSHSKQAAGNVYGIPDSIFMKENEAYRANTHTQHIAIAANEAYGCVGDVPVAENVAYIPAAVNIPTVQNEAYGGVSGAAVNTDTEEQVKVEEMYEYVYN